MRWRWRLRARLRSATVSAVSTHLTAAAEGAAPSATHASARAATHAFAAASSSAAATTSARSASASASDHLWQTGVTARRMWLLLDVRLEQWGARKLLPRGRRKLPWQLANKPCLLCELLWRQLPVV